jgi:hypothetical protein
MHTTELPCGAETRTAYVVCAPTVITFEMMFANFVLVYKHVYCSCTHNIDFRKWMINMLSRKILLYYTILLQLTRLFKKIFVTALLA